MEGPVERYDSHAHFWDLSQASSVHSRTMLGPDVPSVYLCDEYQKDWPSVRRVVHVEAFPSDNLAEVDWLMSGVLSSAPDAIVANCNLLDTASLSRLEGRSVVRGVRQVVSFDEKEAYRCWPGLTRDLTVDDTWRAGLPEVGKRGWSFDLQCSPKQLSTVCEWIAGDYASSVPELIVDHLALPQLSGDSDEAGVTAWRRAMAAAARLPRLYLKVSMLTHVFEGGWTENRRKQVLQMANEAIAMFGSHRCMWAR